MKKYSGIREQIQSGDVLAFRGQGLLSRAIQTFTRSSYSHVGIAWVFRGRVFVLQATGSPAFGTAGVGLSALSEMANYGTCDWLQTGVDWSDSVEALALSDLGKPYSYTTALCVGLGVRFSRKAEICSLYVMQILAAAGINVQQWQGSPESVVSGLLDINAPLTRIKVAE